MTDSLFDAFVRAYAPKPGGATERAVADLAPPTSGPDAKSRDLTQAEWDRIQSGFGDVGQGVALGMLGTLAGPGAGALAKLNPYRGFGAGSFATVGGVGALRSLFDMDPGQKLRTLGRNVTDTATYGLGTGLYNSVFGKPDEVEAATKVLGVEPPALTQAAATRGALIPHPQGWAQRSDAEAVPVWLQQLHALRK